MTIDYAYKLFMQEQKFRGNSNQTIDYYKITLNMFFDFCGDILVQDLDVFLFKNYQIFLLEHKNIKRVSIRTYARAVRVFYRFLFFNDFLDIDINKLQLIKFEKDIILPLTDEEVVQLLQCFKKYDFLGERDKLICMLMLDCGLRRGEVVKLKDDDINMTSQTIIVNGKGSKQRLVPFGCSVKKQISIYKTLRGSHFSDTFINTVDRLSVSDNTIKMLFQRLKKQSGIERLYPHLLRHTFATNYIFQGGNLEVLRVLLGHSTIAITQIYIHLATQMHIVNDNYESHLDTLS